AGAHQSSRQVVADAHGGSVIRGVGEHLIVQIRKGVADVSGETRRERVREKALKLIGIRVDSDSRAFVTKRAIGYAEAQTVRWRHLPRHSRVEGVAPGLLPAG